jgi:hypothetical protein
MLLETGFQTSSRAVHLTHTTLTGEALCGESGIDCLGEPDLAAICEDCDRIGRELGLEHDHWSVVQIRLDVAARAA